MNYIRGRETLSPDQYKKRIGLIHFKTKKAVTKYNIKPAVYYILE